MRALEETIAGNPQRASSRRAAGIVTEPATYDLLLARCFTVWLRATPEEHMERVVAQGDLRPMAGNAEAMEDLKRILVAREAALREGGLCTLRHERPVARRRRSLALRDTLRERLTD